MREMIKKYFALQLTCILVILNPLNTCRCFVAHWGERCSHSAECTDHRMICHQDEDNITRCICDRFHAWNGTEYGCIQIFSTEEIINRTIKISDNEGKLARDQLFIMKGPLFSAVFLLCVGFVCSISVIGYCLHMRRSDRKMKQHLQAKFESNRENTKPSKPIHLHLPKQSTF